MNLKCKNMYKCQRCDIYDTIKQIRNPVENSQLVREVIKECQVEKDNQPVYFI